LSCVGLCRRQLVKFSHLLSARKEALYVRGGEGGAKTHIFRSISRLAVANEIAKFVNWLQKTATWNRNLQPEIETHEYSNTRGSTNRRCTAGERWNCTPVADRTKSEPTSSIVSNDASKTISRLLSPYRTTSGPVRFITIGEVCCQPPGRQKSDDWPTPTFMVPAWLK